MLDAQQREINALNHCLEGAEAELAEAAAELESSRQELARQSERIVLLDRVATLLAERAIERQRELRAVRPERQLDGGSRGTDQAPLKDAAPGPKPAISPNGTASPIRQAS